MFLLFFMRERNNDECVAVIERRGPLKIDPQSKQTIEGDFQ